MPNAPLQRYVRASGGDSVRDGTEQSECHSPSSFGVRHLSSCCEQQQVCARRRCRLREVDARVLRNARWIESKCRSLTVCFSRIHILGRYSALPFALPFNSAEGESRFLARDCLRDAFARMFLTFLDYASM
uniref:Uncharacterized protein n=1 Tax=Odontella aurita TaxID=265563 RepID=A0A7S4K7Q0_9STRA